MKLDKTSAALLAIDLQVAFCAEQGSVARQGRDVSPCREAALRCLELAKAARANGIPVIWTRFVLRSDYADGGVLISDIRPGIKTTGGLRAGTTDIELIPEVTVAATDHVIDKCRYSAFYATHLEAVLRSLAVDCLIIGGVTTSMCVESTARDAGQRDYRTFVVAEACGDFDPSRHDASLAALEFGFAKIISSDSALAAFTGELMER